MAPVPVLLAIGATAAFIALCLALGLGLISPKRFAQCLGGGACGLMLGGAAVLIVEGQAYG